MPYKSTKCIDGMHTECVTGPGSGHSEECSCGCHELAGDAREVLTHMTENKDFCAKMLQLISATLARQGSPYAIVNRAGLGFTPDYSRWAAQDPGEKG